MQRPEGPLTEDPYTQESRHDHGIVFFALLKQPLPKLTLSPLLDGSSLGAPLGTCFGTQRTMTARDVTQPGNWAIFSTFCGHFFAEVQRKPGEKKKNPPEKSHTKSSGERPEIADFCPLSCRARVLTLMKPSVLIPFGFC